MRVPGAFTRTFLTISGALAKLLIPFAPSSRGPEVAAGETGRTTVAAERKRGRASVVGRVVSPSHLPRL